LRNVEHLSGIKAVCGVMLSNAMILLSGNVVEFLKRSKERKHGFMEYFLFSKLIQMFSLHSLIVLGLICLVR
jgi:hypothetical protein